MNQRGFSLVEILVACAVLGIVLAGIVGLQQQGQRTYLWVAARVDSQQSARLAVALMTRELRSAATVTACSGNSISFTDVSTNAISYSLSGSNLIRSAPGVASPNDQLVGGVQSLTITCYQADGYTATTTAANVRSVLVSVQTQSGSTAAAGVQQTVVADRVRLRNL